MSDTASPDANVIAFPARATPPSKSGAKSGAKPGSKLESRSEEFRDWMSWAECELAILGYDLSACDYDWRAAHTKGLRPEIAAEQAARGLDAD
ncbi:MAG: hypothetical protein ACFB13_19050 [Kiloniellaceae bacterium]